MSPESLFNALDRAGPVTRLVIKGLRHRGELAALEAAVARDHLVTTLIFGFASLVLALLGGFAANFAFAASIWHREDRAWFILAAALLQLSLALLAAVATVRRLRDWQPWTETRQQLTEDYECVERLMPKPTDAEPETTR